MHEDRPRRVSSVPGGRTLLVMPGRQHLACRCYSLVRLVVSWFSVSVVLGSYESSPSSAWHTASISYFLHTSRSTW
eukprot:scaffold30518_cov67-Phaeocystis_antarctica.AAC.4